VAPPRACAGKSRVKNRIAVEYTCTDVLPEKIGNDVALGFFRILHEALENVAEHSQASNVRVELIGGPRELLLRVSDDGTGVDLQKAKVTIGLGFIRMKERLRAIGGELAVWSTPTRGTQNRSSSSHERISTIKFGQPL